MYPGSGPDADGEPRQHAGDRLGQEVLAPVDPHVLGQPARRPVRRLHGHRGPQRGQDALPRRSARGDRRPAHRVRAGVHEPRHPRLDQPAPGVDLYRSLNMVGLPDRVAVRPGPLQEHVVRPTGTLPAGQARPVPGEHIAGHRALQRRQARRRRAAGLRRRSQLPVHRRDVAPPERHALPDLVGDLETLARPAVQALTRASLTHPPPHRALGDPQAASRQPDLLRAQPALTLQGSQAPHNRRTVRPVHGPGTYRPDSATDSQMTESLTTR